MSQIKVARVAHQLPSGKVFRPYPSRRLLQPTTELIRWPSMQSSRNLQLCCHYGHGESFVKGTMAKFLLELLAALHTEHRLAMSDLGTLPMISGMYFRCGWCICTAEASTSSSMPAPSLPFPYLRLQLLAVNNRVLPLGRCINYSIWKSLLPMPAPCTFKVRHSSQCRGCRKS